MSGFGPTGWLKGADLQHLPATELRRELRKRWFLVLGGALAALAVLAGLWGLLIASRYVSTDNAYVKVSSAQATPLTSGTVLAVPVHDTQYVRRGEELMRIDPADAELAYAQADAAYRLTVRKVRGYYAAVDARRADLARARFEYERRAKIGGTGAVSGEELVTVKNAYAAAKAALEAAEALTEGTDLMHHPEVEAARAARDTAKLNLDRTTLRAPVDGIVTGRAVQVGQRVQAGTPVMTVVPIGEVHVDANFKEDQLAKVRPGQPVELVSDLYGSAVKFHGTVAGLSGGTGAAFALIPAQNATGNWIKVVQRVPVRIDLDPKELQAHPLRVGLSMTATIDVSK